MLEEVEVELKYHPRPFCLQPPGFAQAFSFCECEGWGGLGLEKLMLINHCLKNLRILCRYVSQVLHHHHHHHHHHHATFGQHIYSQECYQIKVLVFVLGVNPTWCMVGAPSSGDQLKSLQVNGRLSKNSPNISAPLRSWLGCRCCKANQQWLRGSVGPDAAGELCGSWG